MQALRFSLRTWLLGLSLLATLPMLVFALSVVREFKDFQERVLATQLERRSDALSDAVGRKLESTVGTLTALAESEAALALDVPRLYDHARRVIQRDPDLRAVTLVDTRHILFLTSVPLSRKDLQLPVNAAHLVEAALHTQSPNVSGPFPSPVSPATVVAVTVPILRGGTATHALRGILAVESFNRLVAADKLPAGWIAGIADAEGALVARSHDAARHVGQPASASFQRALATSDNHAFTGTTLEEAPTINRVRPVFGFDWFLAVAVPQDILHAPLHEMLWHLAGLGVLWLVVSALLAIGFSHYLARQMQAVLVAVERKQDALPGHARIRIAELIDVFQRIRAAQRSEVSMRHDLHAAVTTREQVQDLYDHAPCGYHSLDADGRVLRMNQTELAWLGLPLAQVRGRPYLDFLTPESQDAFRHHFPRFVRAGHIKDLELHLQRSDGSAMPILISATAILDAQGAFLASRSTVFDHTEKKQAEAQLDRLARIDALTGLSNRRDFYERAQREIARCRATDQTFSVLMLDVDFFKKINDQFGHAGGDEVLRQLASVLLFELREGDQPGRLGGEEFAVLMPGTPLADAQQVAERLRASLQQAPVALGDGRSTPISASIGLAQWQPQDADIDATLQRADAALYRAKHTGRNRVCSTA